jgi:hypothetical protein
MIYITKLVYRLKTFISKDQILWIQIHNINLIRSVIKHKFLTIINICRIFQPRIQASKKIS